MSKQIAQTVGDKRIAVLLAIVAAFAVLATVGTQWRQADADVSQASYSLTGPFANGTPECTTAAPTTVLVGSNVHYCVVAIADATRVNPVEVTVTIPGFDITDVQQLNLGGPQPTCSSISGTGGSVTCTYSGLTPSSTFQMYVGGHYTAAQNLAAGGGATTAVASAANATVDDPSNQPAIYATNNTVATDVVAPTFTKTAGAAVASGGGTATYTIVYTHPALAQVITAGNLDISDTFTPANGSALISAVLSGTNAADMSCTVPSATSFTCTNTAQIDPGDTFTVTVSASVPANGTGANIQHCNAASLSLSWSAPAGGSYTASDTGNCIAQAEPNSTGQTLIHVPQPSPARDRENNVIGYRHTVCALNDLVDAIWPNTLPGASNNFQIKTISGTANIEAPVVTTGIDCDADSVADDSSVSWYSTSTGEQDITVVNDAGSTLYGYSGTGATTVPLVKEWNVLEPTWITSGAGVTITQGTPDTISGTNLDGKSVSGTMTFNPVTGKYEGVTGNYYENVIASHTNAAGTQLSFAYGATVRFTRGTSTCGSIIVNGVTLDTAGEWTELVSAGAPIPFYFDSATTNVSDCTSPSGSTSVTITVTYPTLLGSDQPPSPAPETLTVNWTGTVAAKQVFLAWAGQRIILEHDWRLPAGDTDGGAANLHPTPLGVCPWGATDFGPNVRTPDYFDVTYIKGSGPGNFIAGLNDDRFGGDAQYGLVVLNGSDQATVYNIDANDALQDNTGTSSDDSPLGPQDACISRVLYESEDQGQVDIEAFAISVSDTIYPATGERLPVLNNATKHAFVIYYMKINTVNVSLVTQVEKPSHNSSTRLVSATTGAKSTGHLADYAPGNPWDASKDDADNAAEWNVSKDLLVRGRVTGWFVNSNPSGRAADTTNPLNVLPANRWVMPNDWPLLAGGPADPADGTDAVGTAEQFRPYYDIMFAPNNTRGINLTTPYGNAAVQVAVVVANAANSTSRVNVTSCNDLPAGQGFVFASSATTARSVTTCVANVLTFSPAAASIPAALTGIIISTGVPFEGPYSTIDIVGFAFQGLGGAALSDLDPNNIRDAAADDGDVDWWDAPMPVAPVSVAIRGTGFIKAVYKADVYWQGTANSSLQVYPNPYYIVDITASPWIPAVVAGGGFFWDTWSNDGPGGLGQGVYEFWRPAIVGTNSAGFGDTFTTAQTNELAAIRVAYGDNTIARDLVVYSDNHGEFMVTANGDYRTDLTACTTNVLAGGKHCKPGDKVGTGTITATVDYPDFRGKHFPVLSNAATVTWTWGGYKDVTIEAGETDQFKYIVFHGIDRDGFCYTGVKPGAVSLHPLLSGAANDTFNGNPAETVDFLIDSGEGIIIDLALPGVINDGKQFATGVKTFSTLLNDPAVTGVKEFPLSSLAATGAVDECQAWIKVSNSLLGILNVLVIAHDDEGNIGFDKIIDLTNTTSYTLNFRWSLVTWAGADDISVSDAIKGTGTSGKNPGGNDISASVTAIYGWDAAAQQWLGYFPSGVNVPGANDLVSLKTGQAYWIAITGPSSVTWTIASNVN